MLTECSDVETAKLDVRAAAMKPSPDVLVIAVSPGTAADELPVLSTTEAAREPRTMEYIVLDGVKIA